MVVAAGCGWENREVQHEALPWPGQLASPLVGAPAQSHCHVYNSHVLLHPYHARIASYTDLHKSEIQYVDGCWQQFEKNTGAAGSPHS